MALWVQERAHAKINLTLDVLGKRDDGYHEVEMVMQSVDLSDHLRFTAVEDDQITLSCDIPYVPTDERNLVVRAAQLLKRQYSVRGGVRMELSKHIPVGAGLAGGSTDAAAALRGLNRLWRLGLTREELLELCGQIGSDVPFCLEGGTAIAQGRGERLVNLQDARAQWVVLAKPPFSVSTADTYRRYDPNKVTRRPNRDVMLSALQSGDLQVINRELCNVLESVTSARYPQVVELKRRMLRNGAQAALMSGSGPTVFAIGSRERHVRRIYGALRGHLRDVFLCRFSPRRVVGGAASCLPENRMK